ncbi:MAG: carboxylesterase/lipase family protein [Lachnospiraceae bacterium]|nr:carboxylesterase/lipase family protein [Lachnospiraceae bacterium]
MYPRKLTKAIVSRPDFPVAETKAGKVRGLLEEDVFIFRGVQYAKAQRFHMPEPVDPWEGSKEAVIYGPVSPEIHTPIAHDEYNVPHYHYIQDEECHYVNIWTPTLDKNARKPVMFWIHGGGFSTGSSIELYAYDGQELALWGDVVVVSVNHRLNCIGYLDLSSFGEEYKYTGNLGQVDLVCALQWVHDNIAAFGGDPDNVTIMGQSGGGGKVNALMSTPSAAGLFHKAVIQSGLMPGGRDTRPEQSQKIGEAVAAELGLTKETIKKIETIPYYKLARAAQSALQKLGLGGMAFGPVRDDDFYLGSASINPFMESTKNVPMLIGSVLGEFDQNYNQIYAPGSKNDWDEETVNAVFEKVFGDKAEAVKAAQKKAYPKAKVIDAVFTNKAMRIAARDYCKKRFEEGCAPAYNWLFNLECPMNNGTVPWHNAEEAYMFHNANYLEASYIPGVSEDLQDQMTGAWVAFARTGNPNHAGMKNWDPVDDRNGACMIFDKETRQECHHDDELMEVMPQKPMGIGNDRAPQTTFGGGPRQSL